MYANRRASCINTRVDWSARGAAAGALRGWFCASVGVSRANGKCERSARHDRESWFHRGWGVGRGVGRVSRGNKFRQIVLPALYTVAHEVERSVPSVPADQPSRDRCVPPPSVPPPPPPPLRRPTVDTCTSVIAGEGDMRLAPLLHSTHPFAPEERKRCLFLPAVSFAPATPAAPPAPPSTLNRVLVLSTPLGINPLLYIPRTYTRFSYCDRRAPTFSFTPFSPHLHAVMYPLLVFPTLSSALIPTCRAEGFLDSPLLPSLPLKSMPVCSRPFHHACSPAARPRPSLFSPAIFRRQPSPPPLLLGASSLEYVPDFRCHCRFPSARASMRSTCVHLRVNPSSLFSPVLPRLSNAPLPPVCFLTIGISLAVITSCVTLRPAYVSISRRLLFSHFHATIDTLSRSAHVLSATRRALNSNKSQQNFAYYISAERTRVFYICI